MTRGDNCISACATRDHETWGECRRENGLRVAYCQSWKGRDATRQKRWDRGLENYRRARKQGIQPASTYSWDVDRAVRQSDKTGEAFKATR